jgi:hypothetical protein
MMSLGLLQTSLIIFIFLLFIDACENAITTLLVCVQHKFGNYPVNALLWEIIKQLPILGCINVLVLQRAVRVLLNVAPFFPLGNLFKKFWLTILEDRYFLNFQLI